MATLPPNPNNAHPSRHFPPLPTDVELVSLYPADLELVNAQILFRHGERTPVRARFQTWGLAPFWPYCTIAQRFTHAIVNLPFASDNNDEHGSAGGQNIVPAEYVRKLESVAKHVPFNLPVPAHAGTGRSPQLSSTFSTDNLCMLGELTDLGRRTGFILGERLRWLYVDKLNFLPDRFSDPSFFYFRSSHISRSNETLLSLLHALYPPTLRDGLRPTIFTRLFPQENSYPNDENCKRLSELGFMFAEIVASRWNPILARQDGVSGAVRDAVPDGVAIDGSPRASGIFDTVSSCVAHGVDLPDGFKRADVVATIRDAVVDEWYLGVQKSAEYRRLAVGALVGDFLYRIKTAAAAHTASNIEPSASYKLWLPFWRSQPQPQVKPEKLALYASHDTTIASILSALRVFDNTWPPFTSDLRFELFADTPTTITTTSTTPPNYYVRLTYNDVPLTLPSCAKYYKTDKTLCSLQQFEAAVNEFIPRDWERECRQNLGKPVLDNDSIAQEYSAVAQQRRQNRHDHGQDDDDSVQMVKPQA
ncbi:histidine phosphatase superfamily [Lipomyces japonicus]|uniref:histidine phosphatase superfamily n=1 Tax=Lipomyces japonicus TaxID=56871 RepID=UPI0034CF1E67